MTKPIKDDELDKVAGGTETISQGPPTGSEAVDLPDPVETETPGGSHPTPGAPKRV